MLLCRNSRFHIIFLRKEKIVTGPASKSHRCFSFPPKLIFLVILFKLTKESVYFLIVYFAQ